ncbi:type II toxin-antitoxin system VapC family toxin [Gemmatimonas groenlandica]|uniref:Ribonuclease VapC n=1 Tax=Gemmatimonas groenlandica TaxID=2732249 RepID=A0A6M4IT23_9BACT|nr:type II toxin-antitoxin system VapC family toxin [Gemmatimonas groenlandica]QJR37883.1 type II toxin-antitoxin system VapC family toxin [Gemmatimonas groenlandica]
MILDSSALVAIVLQEQAAERLLQRMRDASFLAIGAATLLETGIVLSARLHDDARGLLARVLQESGITVVDVTEAHFGVAMDAWLRYGKGRHPAALNFGDCLSYAIAVVAGAPLLCVGDDFPQTDCVLA